MRKDQCPEPEATPPHLSWKHSHVTFAPPLVQLISDAFMLLAYMWTPLSDPTTGKESWEASQEEGGKGGGREVSADWKPYRHISAGYVSLLTAGKFPFVLTKSGTPAPAVMAARYAIYSWSRSLSLSSSLYHWPRPTGSRRRGIMVSLGSALLKQFPPGANHGLYAGKGIMHGVRVTFSNKK